MAKYKKFLSVITCDDSDKVFEVFKIISEELTEEGYKLEKNKLYCKIKGKGTELYFVSHDNLEEFKDEFDDSTIIVDIAGEAKFGE